MMLPAFDPDEIESVHINRAFKVQPLQVIDYSRLVPRVATMHPDFFVLNTSQFMNATLNNNEVIRAVDDFLRDRAQNLESLRPPRQHRRSELKAEAGGFTDASAAAMGSSSLP